MDACLFSLCSAQNRTHSRTQIKHLITLICLSCNSSPARIWVRIRHAERVELARKRQVSVYSSLMKFLYAHRPHSENLRFSESGFAFAARRSASLFARRRVSKYSPSAKFPYIRPRPLLCRNILLSMLNSYCSQRGTSLHEKR